jgi:hypothetical protein
MLSNRAPQAVDRELVLATLAEPERLGLYLSPGFGPSPAVRGPEQPEFVRVGVLTSAPPEQLQAGCEAWRAAAEGLLAGPLPQIEARQLLAPTADSGWAEVPAEQRAELLRRGIELLLEVAPEVAVFHITDEFGAGMLVRIQSGLSAGEPRLDAALLEHMVFASLTYRLLAHPGEAVVVTGAEDGTWSLRQVFPEHAAVWRRALVRAPAEALAGLALADLAEAVVRARATRRGRAEVTAAAIAEVLAAAEIQLKPRLTDLLREPPGGKN